MKKGIKKIFMMCMLLVGLTTNLTLSAFAQENVVERDGMSISSEFADSVLVNITKVKYVNQDNSECETYVLDSQDEIKEYLENVNWEVCDESIAKPLVVSGLQDYRLIKFLKDKLVNHKREECHAKIITSQDEIDTYLESVNWEVCYEVTNEPEIYTREAYTSEQIDNIMIFSVGDDEKAMFDQQVTVWKYPSGKVHIYKRTLHKAIFDSDYSNSFFTAGNIVNTDGSLSYMHGDKVSVRKGRVSYNYDIVFYITPTYRYYNYVEE